MKNPWDTVEDTQHYTDEELVSLKKKMPDNVTMSIILGHPNYPDVLSYLNAKIYSPIKNDSNHWALYYAGFRRMMFEEKFERLPLHINDRGFSGVIAAWRLKLGR